MSIPSKTILGLTRTKTADCLRLNVQDIPHRRRGQLRIDEGTALLRIDMQTVRLIRADPLGTLDLKLARSKTPTGGQQIHFICPTSGQRCRVLFVDGDRVGTSRALGLAYPSQSRSPRRRAADRQERLIEQVSNPHIKQKRRAELTHKLDEVAALLKGTDEESWQAAVVLEDQRVSLRASRRRVRVLHPPTMSSRAAMMEGRRVGNRATSAAICRALDYYVWVGLSIEPPCRPPTSLETASAYPFLDIRDFEIGQGHAPGRLLVWPDTLEGSLYIRTRLDDQRQRLLVCADGQDRHRVQVIELAVGRRKGDRFMLCPVTGQRHLRLYFRGGRFAGRAAQHLMTATEWERWRRQVGR